MKKIIYLLAFGVLLTFNTPQVFATPGHGGAGANHSPMAGHVQMGHAGGMRGGNIGHPQPMGHGTPHAIMPARVSHHIAPPPFIRPIYMGYYGYNYYPYYNYTAYYNPYYSYTYYSEPIAVPVTYTPMASPVVVSDPYAGINTTANVINTAANVASTIRYITH